MSEGEEDYEVKLIVMIVHEEVVTAKSRWGAIEQAEEMFLDNITRKQALDLIEENIEVESVINEKGESV